MFRVKQRRAGRAPDCSTMQLRHFQDLRWWETIVYLTVQQAWTTRSAMVSLEVPGGGVEVKLYSLLASTR